MQASKTHNSLIMTSVDVYDAPTATDMTRKTEEESLESICDFHLIKKTFEPITGKAKMECHYYGVVAVCDSTKLVCNSAKKIGGDNRPCTSRHSDHFTKFHNDLFKNIIAESAVRKAHARQEVNGIIEQQASTIESCKK